MSEGREEESSQKRGALPLVPSGALDLTAAASLPLLLRTAFHGTNCPLPFLSLSPGGAASAYYGQLCEVSTEKPLKKGTFPPTA